MKRILEPSIMTGKQQCLEYSNINRTNFMKFVLSNLPNLDNKLVAEFGSGSGQLADLILQKFDVSRLDLIDASSPMQNLARKKLGSPNNVRYVQKYIEDVNQLYDVIICVNSAHHFKDFRHLLSCIENGSYSSTQIFVVDLHRPSNYKNIHAIISSCFPQLERESFFYKDFFNSLRAAFSYEEIYNYLINLHYTLDKVKIPNTLLEVWMLKNYETI